MPSNSVWHARRKLTSRISSVHFPPTWRSKGSWLSMSSNQLEFIVRWYLRCFNSRIWLICLCPCLCVSVIKPQHISHLKLGCLPKHLHHSPCPFPGVEQLYYRSLQSIWVIPELSPAVWMPGDWCWIFIWSARDLCLVMSLKGWIKPFLSFKLGQ